jgi:hypothetical protein
VDASLRPIIGNIHIWSKALSTGYNLENRSLEDEIIMALSIKITDGKNASTVVECEGSQNPIIAAGQITDWSEGDTVIIGGTKTNKQPFRIGGGDCHFSSGTLTFYAVSATERPGAPRKLPGDKFIFMLLHGCPAKPKPGSSGKGQLKKPSAEGALVDGPIKWEILAPPPPPPPSPGGMTA